PNADRFADGCPGRANQKGFQVILKSWRAWLRSCFRSPRCAVPPRQRVRLLVEAMEDRIVPASLSITPVNPTVPLLAPLQLHASEVNDQGITLDVTQQVSWLAVPQNGQGIVGSAGSASPGLFIGTFPGTVVVQAQDTAMGLQATDMVMVIGQLP